MSDHLHFFLFQEGNFEIPICALLPEVKIDLPETIDFGLCAVEDNIQLSFEIKNVRYYFRQNINSIHVYLHLRFHTRIGLILDGTR